MTPNNELSEALSRPWNYEVEYWDDGGGYYAVRVLELPGCVADGKTPMEAFQSLQGVMSAYLESMLKHGEAIPQPMRASDFRGQISYRTKPEKHYRLAKEARRRGISINRLIEEALEERLSG